MLHRDRSARALVASRASLLLFLAPFCAALGAVEPSGAAGVFNVQTVDNTSAVGYSASLDYDSLGRPHIAYYDQTHGDLKYASWNGTSWVAEVADGLGAPNVGTYSALAIDSQDRPHISYYDQTNAELKYCLKSGGVWTAEVVDASVPPHGWFTSIALDVNDNPRISYQDQTAGDLKYAAKNGGIWSRESVDIGGNVGWYTSLALDPSGLPRISYFDLTNQDLKYAARSLTSWTVETVDAPGCKGSYTSLALRGTTPVIAYYDCTNGNLRLAEKLGATWTLTNADTAGNVGMQASMRLGSDGQPRIAYQRAPVGGQNGVLKFAWRASSGQWTSLDVDTPSHYTYYASLRLDAGDIPHIAYQDFGGNDQPPTDSELLFAEIRMTSGVPDPPKPGALLRVSPNPIVSAARIELTLASAVDRLQVRVFDVAGRPVASLHDGSAVAGPFEVFWNGRASDGRPVASGLYYVRAVGPGIDGAARAIILR